MSESGLPREYRRGERGFRDVPAVLEPIVGDCSRLGGELPGLFLFGPSKGFKTTIAASALADWIRIPSVDQHGKLTHRGGRYVDATDLMTELQATYNADSTESREDIVTRYAEAPALVVDDLGQEAATAHAGSVLRQILDRRRREYRPGTWLIVTSNRTPEQLRDRFGEPETGNAILHRLAQLCVTIPVAGGKP